MTDEEIKNFVDTDPTAFVNQPFWKQFLILFAGSAVNFIFGFLLIIVVYSIVAFGQVSFARILSVSWNDCFSLIRDIITFLGGLFNGSSSVDDVSGIVGIVAIVADTASYGVLNVIYLVAILSVNLSIMNILPIPGLDGGRIFVSIVKVLSGGRLSQKAENIINGIGMALLLLLIIFISVKDILKLV
jgi:regulator of sigma E protease